MNCSSEQFVQWITAISTMSKDGITICPLLLEHACRFSADECVCDVPKTRARFFANPQERACYDARTGLCFPREEYPETARRETCPVPPPPLRYPRGAWTAFLKNAGPWKPWWFTP
jgi:hypothetical protein